MDKKLTIKDKLIRKDNGLPDILKFFADLNNSEIKTPVEVANQMLDLLPENIWSDKNAKFLDPCVKSGVFLREIVERLNEGLKLQIPDDYERLQHILENQVFGIALEEIGGLIARRTIYCSRKANDKLHTICCTKEEFAKETNIPIEIKSYFENSEQGNIIYKRCEHSFKNGSCIFCGASEKQWNSKLTANKETHAYQFIHTENPQKIFNMKFDVIIGNPPYQLNDQDTNSENNNSSSASPIYNKFVEQAKKLNPKYLSMIIPSRWLSGGKGLGNFRENMKDGHLSIVHDFQDHKECFPNAFIVGGVMYFLWKSDKTSTDITWFSHELNGKVIESVRDITNDQKIVRDFEADKLKNKILSKFHGATFDEIVLERKPYGLCSSFREFSKKKIPDGIKLYYNEKASLHTGWLPKDFKLTKGIDSLSRYKVLISKAIYTSFAGQSKYGLKPFISEPNSISTETYLVIKAKDEAEAENIMIYMKTNFFYFLLSIAKLSHNTSKKDFAFIPLLDFSKKWTDKELNTKFDLSPDDVSLISKYSPKGNDK